MISTTRMICVCTKHGGDCSRTFVCGGGLFQVYPSPVGDKMSPTGVTRVLRNFTHLHSIHRRGRSSLYCQIPAELHPILL